jgi:hypothetical protein
VFDANSGIFPGAGERIRHPTRPKSLVQPASVVPPENLETMPGAMPSVVVPEVQANTVLEHPIPLGTIVDTSIDAIEDMTQTIEGQADAMFPEAQAVSQPLNKPFQGSLISTEVRADERPTGQQPGDEQHSAIN